MTSKELIESYASGARDFRGANLRGANLRGADLCRATLRDATLRGADLRNADLRGADLSGADLSNADLRGADLSNADLRGADLIGANLSNADLRGADLSNADLSGANLSNADLSNADLRGADLIGANLSGANLSGAAGIPSKSVAVRGLDKKMATVCEKPRALEMGAWHTCKTTHCRAGWAITMLGEKGVLLEEIYGPAAAGALIYHASTGNIPNFYDTNENAMADILACAKKAVKR